VKRSFVLILLASAAPVLAQSPAARLLAPSQPYVVRSSPADPDDEGRSPAARLGTVSGARTGDAPDDKSPEESYNWGTPRDRTKAKPTARRSDRDPDNEESGGGRGARLRDPAPGQGTNGHGRRRAGDEDLPPLDNPPPTPGGGPAPAAGPAPYWWPQRDRDLADLREQFPAFGEGDRDRLAFASDCAFNEMISPITNPFLAEDPRSVTELRPIFLYQNIPGQQYYFQGGNAVFLGGQARVAFTDRFSVVLHKLGAVSFNGTNPYVTDRSGLAEIWVGPKFTFWRNPDAQTIASFGLQLQLPVGSGGPWQNTGSLGLVPYVTAATILGETDYGTFHGMNVAGYHFSAGSGRSDYFFDTAHVDLDVGNYHRFYPTLEATWFHYTTNGTARPYLHFEGADLANVGGTAAGNNYLSFAPGFRYKFTEYFQIGVAGEFRLVGTNDISRFRLGIDLIWRY
jgi:hypothetical protein